MRKACFTAALTLVTLSLGVAAFAATPGNQSAAPPTAIAQANSTNLLDANANLNNLKAVAGSHVVAVTTGSQVVATVNTIEEAANLAPNAINSAGIEAINVNAKNNTANLAPDVSQEAAFDTGANITNNCNFLVPAAPTNYSPGRNATNEANAIALNPTNVSPGESNTALTAALNEHALTNTANLTANNLAANGTFNAANANLFKTSNTATIATAALHTDAFNAGTANTLNNTNTAPEAIPNGAVTTASMTGTFWTHAAANNVTTSPGRARVVNAVLKVNANTGTTAPANAVV